MIRSFVLLWPHSGVHHNGRGWRPNAPERTLSFGAETTGSGFLRRRLERRLSRKSPHQRYRGAKSWSEVDPIFYSDSMTAAMKASRMKVRETMSHLHAQPISRRQCACVVLVSGGIDSAACIDFYQRQRLEVSGLHVTYGQAGAHHEAAAARAVARHYRARLTLVRLVGVRPKSDGELLGRNGLLLFTALMELEDESAILALGIHSGTPYYDCSSSFLSTIQALVDGQCDGRIRVVAPFLEWTKKDIWDYCLANRVPIELTYSCERGLEQPCGVCLSCRDLEALRACQTLHNPA